MNYEKLSVDRFVSNLKDGKYSGLTGARRAIGKADWSKKDKERAQEIAAKHFGDTAPTAKTEKPAKKVAAAKVEKSVKKTAKPVKVAAAKTVKAAKVAKTAATETRTAVPGDAAVVAKQAASNIALALSSRGERSKLEQDAYDAALAEYTLLVGEDAHARIQSHYGAATTTVSLSTSTTESVVSTNGESTNGVDTLLAQMSPEERSQHEILQKVARAAGIPVPS